MSSVYRQQLARIWRDVVRQQEQAVFASAPQLRRRARHDDALPQPGFVGRRYKRGGIVFIGANPGGAQVQNVESDEGQDRLLRKLKKASDTDCLAVFEELMTHLRLAMPTDWQIYRVCVPPVLAGTGYEADDIAFLNLVKWRTGKEQVTATVARASWCLQTHKQVAALRPRVIVALGCSVAGRYLSEFNVRVEKCFILKRIRGDPKLSAEGQAEARRASNWLRRHLQSL